MPKTVAPVIPAGRMAGMDQPVIAAGGGRRLRPWTVEDANVLVAAYEDPAIRHYHGRYFASVEEAATFIEQARDGWAQEKYANWAIVDVADDTVIGRAGLSFVDLAGGVLEISYWVLPEARGTGVARAAVLALVDFTFDVLGAHRLEIMHSVDNLASCAVATGAGFTPEGTLRSALLHDDGWHDMHLHSRVRPA